MRFIIATFVLIFTFSCRENTDSKTNFEEALTAQEIIDRSIEVSGGTGFNNSSLAFRFRDMFYTARRSKGDFSLSRIQESNGDSIIDILSNDGFARFINDEFQVLADSTGQKYAASVNSVHYFSVLPYGLNDPAVKKRRLIDETIKDEHYFKVEITFEVRGGGEDYEDVFIYWIHQSSFKPHFLAYSYAEEDGVGLRFREAYNERYIAGLRFVDYHNFKPSTEAISLLELAQEFENDRLELVSNIELENIQVGLINLK